MGIIKTYDDDDHIGLFIIIIVDWIDAAQSNLYRC